MGNKKLVLHIGTYKTGTTAIQKFLYHNKRELFKQGFNLPYSDFFKDVGVERNGVPILHCALSRMSGKIQLNINYRKPLEDIKLESKRFFDELKNMNGTVILSNEEIHEVGSTLGIEFWKAIETIAIEAGFTEIKILLYLRRQDEFIVSRWKESVKGFMTEEFQEFLTEERNLVLMDYLKTVDDLSEVFGSDNLLIRKYCVNNFENEDICFDFCDALQIDKSKLLFNESIENKSISDYSSLLKLIINNIDSFKQNNFLPSLKNLDNINFCLLKEEQYEFLRQHFQRKNRILCEKYIGEEHAFDFEKYSEIKTSKINSLEFNYSLIVLIINELFKIENEITELKTGREW